MLKIINTVSSKESVIADSAAIIKNDDLFYSALVQRYFEDEEKNFSLFINEQELSLENVFTLKVNVKSVGAFYAFFDKESFNKEEVVKNISELKSLPIATKEEKEKKVEELFARLAANNALFAIADKISDLYFSFEKVSLLSKIPLLFVKKADLPKILQGFTGIHLIGCLSALVSSSVFGAALLYTQRSNLFSIAMYAISLVSGIFGGIVLNNILFKNKSEKFDLKFTICVAASCVIGGGLYATCHYLFLAKDDLGMLAINALIAIFAAALLVAISCVAIVFINKIIEKNKSKKGK